MKNHVDSGNMNKKQMRNKNEYRKSIYFCVLKQMIKTTMQQQLKHIEFITCTMYTKPCKARVSQVNMVKICFKNMSTKQK